MDILQNLAWKITVSHVFSEREHAQALEIERSRQQMEAAVAERDQLASQLHSLKVTPLHTLVN